MPGTGPGMTMWNRRPPLSNPNDPKLRALEAYIYAQRKGVALEYGKH